MQYIFASRWFSYEVKILEFCLDFIATPVRYPVGKNGQKCLIKLRQFLISAMSLNFVANSSLRSDKNLTKHTTVYFKIIFIFKGYKKTNKFLIQHF